MRIDVLDQLVRIFFHTEEIGILLGLVDQAAADRTLALFLNLGRGIEGLTLLAVHAAVVSEINVALIIELLEDLLNLALVIRIRRADETVVGSAHKIPETLDLACNLVDKCLGALAGAGGSGLNLLAVLVRTGHEADIEPVCSLITRDTVRENNLISIADMRLTGRVRYRSCNIIFSFILHDYIPPSSVRYRRHFQHLPKKYYHSIGGG